MSLYPPLRITWLNGFLLILPLLVLRYGIPGMINKKALAELDYFPPVQGLESFALQAYFITNTFLIFSPLLAEIKTDPGSRVGAWLVYLSGVMILTWALIDYSRQDGLKTGGIYRYSRNPICVGYFLIYLGTSLLITSWTHLLLTLIYQVSVHYLILSEERWCQKEFGLQYQEYHQLTARYVCLKGKHG